VAESRRRASPTQEFSHSLGSKADLKPRMFFPQQRTFTKDTVTLRLVPEAAGRTERAALRRPYRLMQTWGKRLFRQAFQTTQADALKR
jgi:hypothetical protein